MSSWAYEAQTSIDRALVSSLKQIFNEYKQRKLIDPSYSLEGPSLEGKKKEFLINNIESVYKPLGISISTIMSSTSYTSMYVPITYLLSEVTFVKDIILRAICIQSNCVLPQIIMLGDKVCLMKATSSLCSDNSNGPSLNGHHGLSFSITNLGMRQQLATSYQITLSSKQKLVSLSRVYFSNITTTNSVVDIYYQRASDGSLNHSSISIAGSL